MNKKKLLIMASLFWPQKNGGGPPISIMNVVKSIKNDFSTYVISKNHEVNDDKPLEGVVNGWNEFEFGKVFYTPHGEHTVKNILRIIEDISPDVIYENSFFSQDDMYPVALYKRTHKNVKVIVAPRGEFYPERLAKGGIKKKLYKSIFKFSGLLDDIYWQATGDQEMGYIKEFMGVDNKYIYNVNNITFTEKEQRFIEKEQGKIKLVFIARIHPMKNLLFAIRILKDVKADVVYNIYGPVEDSIYWENCKKEIDALAPNIKINYCGQASHADVCDIIMEHHAYFMPTIGENYGHSIVESLMCWRPVIISDKTPWKDLEKFNAGYAVSLDNKEGFVKAIEKLAETDNNEFKKISLCAYEYIDKKLNNKTVLEDYKKMFS